MRIVVGLGNPGRRYMRTRHNAGFMAAERLALRWDVDLRRESAALHVGKGAVGNVSVMLVQPQQYMNASGESLARLRARWRAEDLVVLHDDIDLAAGQLRVRHNGSFAGHRGLESIGAICGRDFDRVRIGVGRPPEDVDPADFVLERLEDVELRELHDTVERACLAVECLLIDGISEAMNRFNTRVRAGQKDEPRC